MEEWKTVVIDGEQWHYEVSTDGNVRNTETGRILKHYENEDNYLYVRLCNNGKCKQFYVHRLVGIMFIPNTNNLQEINHIDKNRHNNHVSNLEWTTHGNNIRHSHNVRIKCVETGQVFDSLKQACDMYNMSIGNLWKALNGKTKSCKGFHWEYVD